MVFEKLREVIAEIFEVEADNVRPELRFSDDLCGDVMDLMELSMIAEEEFEVLIDDEDFPKIQTVGDLVSYIEARMDATMTETLSIMLRYVSAK